jgi:hypothetical protein
MSARAERLRPGDIVEVRGPDEILQTLNAEGAMGHLPFMPEMLAFHGQRLRVSRRALTVCYYGTGGGGRGFDTDNVVTLDSTRCSGAAHGGCQKSCMVFWREEWLRKVEHHSIPLQADLAEMGKLRRRVTVSTNSARYYCQASELLTATHKLSRSERMIRYLNGLRSGNFNVLDMLRGLTTFLIWKLREKLFGIYARGSGTSASTDSLNLQPGEWVEVKPLKSIIKTLDGHGLNRGLFFSPDMRLWCGRKLRVKARLDKMVADGTGQMRHLRNTVLLEGSTCGCSYMGLGMAGCSRCEFTYWREIWLRRCGKHDT